MKSKFKIIAILFVLGAFTTGLKAVAEEKTKEYNEEWAASDVQTLEIDNKFGEIKIVNDDRSQVTIDVIITVEAPNERRTDEYLEMINVEFRKSGSTVRAETEIENDFKSRQKFSIDYTVNIPSDKNLKITNKYGNTILNVLNANGDFDIKYGNFTANELRTPESGKMNLTLAYGKAEVGLSNIMELDIKYSNMNIEEMGNLKVLSKYSVLKIEESGILNIDSKYDTFEFEETESVKANTKFSNIKIEELKKSLHVDAGYGGIKVAEVASDFESISIENSYGQIRLGLDDASYSLDASCNYCGISYPENDFEGNRMKENHTQTLKGKVGTVNGGTVYVRSRYGEIKLQ